MVEASGSCSKGSVDFASFAALQARRRSCRKFLPESLSQDEIEAIFASAQHSASWCNVQPWKAYITAGEATDRFRRALWEEAKADEMAANAPDVRSSGARRSDFPMPREYSGVRGERRKNAGRALYECLGVLGDRKASYEYALENFNLFGAPHAAIITVPEELGEYGVLDAGGYLANVMLALESFGASSIAQAALAIYGDVVRDFFSIASNEKIICGLSFGFADRSFPANSFPIERADLSEVVAFYG